MNNKFRFHDLQHGRVVAQAGVDLDTLADLMGYNHIHMTWQYAYIGNAHLTNAIGQLGKSYGEMG